MVFTSCSDDDPVVLSAEDQLAIDIEKIDAFLANEEITAEIHESGIRYVTTLEGTGDQPTLADGVTAKYEGRFLNGNVFDASTTGATFPLNGVIAAWQITLPLMREGGKITIYAPSGYCYGSTGTGGIPPNENLIFDIELLSVN